MFKTNLKDLCSQIMTMKQKQMPMLGDIILLEDGYLQNELGTYKKNIVTLLPDTKLETALFSYKTDYIYHK